MPAGDKGNVFLLQLPAFLISDDKSKIQKHKHLYTEALVVWLFDRYKQLSGSKQSNNRGHW